MQPGRSPRRWRPALLTVVALSLGRATASGCPTPCRLSGGRPALLASTLPELVAAPPLLAVPGPPPPPRVASLIPPRPRGAPTGSQFLRATAGLSLAAREEAILSAVLSGNIPAFLRVLVPIPLIARTEKAFPAYRGWAWVMPDYLAIGDDHDFVRMPMDPVTAQRIADRFGCLLPTTALVDAVYAAAPAQLLPVTMPPGRAMRSNGYIKAHNARIEAQLALHRHGELVAGQKKDVVITNRLAGRPKRVAIYGWHTGPGELIQPLSTWHKKSYSDYSHGVRLVFATVLVEGEPWPLAEVLRHPEFWLLVSDEGPLREVRVSFAGLEWWREELLPQAPWRDQGL